MTSSDHNMVLCLIIFLQYYLKGFKNSGLLGKRYKIIVKIKFISKVHIIRLYYQKLPNSTARQNRADRTAWLLTCFNTGAARSAVWAAARSATWTTECTATWSTWTTGTTRATYWATAMTAICTTSQSTTRPTTRARSAKRTTARHYGEFT